MRNTKTENANNDAIVDDMAGQAYVEQFGLETFVRAQRAVEANKVTKYELSYQHLGLHLTMNQTDCRHFSSSCNIS
ncbi:hypothetical protein DH86_00000469 [Scytalidium sp. 3C]|nr:hypothetical protein DH86_00000469 [Scytalidium sp. 3C]